MEESHPQEGLITMFMEITNCSSKSESLFFLESHNFDLDSAVSTFLDNNNIDDDVVLPDQINPQQQQVSDDAVEEEQQVSPYRERSVSPQRVSGQNYNLRSGGRTRGGRGKRGGGGGRSVGIRTFADLNKEEEDEEDSDDDEDFDPQEYYAGGEKSGMLVQDPTRRNPTRGGNDVNAIFDQARRSGAVGEPEDHHMPSSSRNFSGTGRLLSGEVSSTPQPTEAVPRTHEVVFWRNGFTVDDGPLRRLNDPENAPFIQSVVNGECPAELAPANRHARVHVNLTRKEGNYEEADRPCLPFQGVGKTLGSTSDATTTAPTNTTPTVVPTESTTSVPTPSQGLVVDESQPSTTIQLRLADGTRLVSRFNNYHTIRDIRGFIDVSRGSPTRNYQLQAMGFPPKQLVDLDQTIDQAGIANSVVIQKF